MNKKPRYCGPQGIGFRYGAGRTEFEWLAPLKSRGSVYYTHKGRCGLGLLCRHWNLKPGDEILMPSYNCGTEVDPFLAYNLTVVFYRVDRSARIDLQDLFGRITKKTKVIYVTHYFGWSQEIRDLSAYCRMHNLYLVEDCALSLFSHPLQHPIGILGDAAIYSFPKTLPVPDGGLLTISGDPPLAEEPAELPAKVETFRGMLPFFKRAVLRLSDSAGLYPYWPGWVIKSRVASGDPESQTPAGLPEMPASYYYDKKSESLTISGMTRSYLRRIDSGSVVQRRRENYSRLFEAVENSEGLKPLYRDLPEGVCPLYLPVLAEDRRTVCVRLNEMGIAAGQWWAGYHRGFDWEEFPEAKYLKDHVLVIPVHPQLDNRHLDYLSDCLARRIDAREGVPG